MTSTAEKNRITAKFRKLFPDIADFRSYSFEKEIRDSYLPLYKVIYQGSEVCFRTADLRKNETWVLFEGLLNLIEKHQSLNSIEAKELESNIENCNEVYANFISTSSYTAIFPNECDRRQFIDGAFLVERQIKGIEWRCDYKICGYGLACNLSNRPSNWKSYYPDPEPEMEVTEGGEVALNYVYDNPALDNGLKFYAASDFISNALSQIKRGEYDTRMHSFTVSYGVCCTLVDGKNSVLEKTETVTVPNGNVSHINKITRPGRMNEISKSIPLSKSLQSLEPVRCQIDLIESKYYSSMVMARACTIPNS